jgi:Cys-rich protein (TIGR01571 family)
MGKDWDETLCGCFSNVPLTLVALLPGGLCVIQSTAVDKLNDRGKLVPYLLVFLLPVIGGAINRETIRKDLDLSGNFAISLLTWLFCGCCAGCQEYREVAHSTKGKH